MTKNLDPSDRMMLRQAVGMVAEELGISFDEAAQMTHEEFAAHVASIGQRAHAEARRLASDKITAERILAAYDTFNVPHDMTVNDAVQRGLIPQEVLDHAVNVTEDDIDTAMGRDADEEAT